MVNLRNRGLMDEKPHSFGTFQWTMSFNPHEISIKDFSDEGLDLPRALGSAVHKRQIEFLCGRLCVKRCLESLGLSAPPPLVPTGKDRAPIWPSGYLGSISHTEGMATSIVGQHAFVESIGIDIERIVKEASPPLVKQICGEPGELDDFLTLRPSTREEALTVIFSAKECLYKAIEPQLQADLGFHVARVRWHRPDGISITIVKDLNADLRSGMTWDLQMRILPGGVVETLILKPRT